MKEQRVAPPDARVLILHSDIVAAKALAASLAADGYACELAADGPAASRAIARHAFDVVISDVQMDEIAGLALVERLSRAHATLPVIIATQLTRPAGGRAGKPHEAFHYLAKPYAIDALEELMVRPRVESEADGAPTVVGEKMARRVKLQRASLLTEAWPALLGSASVMAALQERIERVAASSAPVLIVGESGSGKDVVAHAIHAHGPRHDRPFIAINTSAIPEQLLESEIFGHVRGAFSGASDARRGLFSAADGGTLFLDEIGDMPVGLQAKLLRVIETGEVRAVGADTARRIDVRIVAATHRDLPKLVEADRFREDLYFRLNVLPIVVPPLRERRGDIGELALHFLAQARTRMPSSPVRTITPEALDALSEAAWPGNVRELASTIERLVVFGSEPAISRDSISFLPTASAKSQVPELSLELCSLRHLTDRHIAWVLTQTEGNKVRAADILGINLSTLYRWKRPESAGH